MLLSELKSPGFRPIGAIRENGLSKCPIPPVKQMKKEGTGTYASAFYE